MSGSSTTFSGTPMALAEYHALGEDVRGEYVGGRLMMTPSPTRDHQTACRRLANLLDEAAPEGHVVVEVLSSNPAHDLVLKAGRYADAGLTHFWAVDTTGRTITAFVLEAGHYDVAATAERGAPAELPFLGGSVRVDVNEIVGRPEQG